MLRSNAKRLLSVHPKMARLHISRHITSCLDSLGLYRSSKLLLGQHVKEALANGSPLVALESTVITHGLPEPDNLKLARDLERTISDWRPANVARDASPEELMHEDLVKSNPSGPYNDLCHELRVPKAATPATVGIIKGQLIVGLSGEQIEYLAKKEVSNPIKISRRDIPLAQARGLSGGTTVAATMAIASSLADSPIKVFATGGTGGVHVGGQDSMDISADLYELARSPMGVVSSGFKSFLDTRRSLEFLETMGCTVMSLSSSCSSSLSDPGEALKVAGSQAIGSTHQGRLFPAFFSSANKDGIESPCIVDSISEAAQILFHCLEATPLIERRAALLAVPIPGEFSLDELTDQSLADAMASISAIDKRADLKGCEKTPLILEQLNRQTRGKTLRANVQLLSNNARVGAHLAFEYCKIKARIGAVLPPDQEVHDREGTRVPAAGNGFVEGNTRSRMSKSNSPSGSNSNNNMLHPEGEKQWQSEGIKLAGCSGRHRLSYNELGVAAGAGSVGGTEWLTSARHGPVVVGCTMIDMHVSTKIDDHFENNQHRSGITYPGKPHLALGGVGQNLARGLHLLGHQPSLISALARDKLAEFARSDLASIGFRPGQLRIVDSTADRSTPGSSCFALVLINSDDGQCEYVVADLDAMRSIDESTVEAHRSEIEAAPMLVLDANVPPRSLSRLFRLASCAKVPVFLEPTDVLALPNLLDAMRQTGDQLDSLLGLSPNLVELRFLVSELGYAHAHSLERHCPLADIERAALWLLERHLPELTCLLVTLDARGVLVLTRSAQSEPAEAKLMLEHRAPAQASRPIRCEHIPTPRVIERPVSASGAGDCFAAGFISGLLRDFPLARCIDLGFQAAKLALEDPSPIPVTLSSLAPEAAQVQ